MADELNKALKRVFEENESQTFPVKLNGKIIGEGVLQADGSVKLNIEDEDAYREMTAGAVGGLSINYNSKTIEAIMNNRKKRQI